MRMNELDALRVEGRVVDEGEHAASQDPEARIDAGDAWRAAAVFLVADNRVPGVRQMDPNLMGSSSAKGGLDPIGEGVTLD
jgi:hypothetical protein